MTAATPCRALMVFIEPTPYINAFALAMNQGSGWRADSLFISENLSQPWGLDLVAFAAESLPPGFWAAIGVLSEKLKGSQYRVLHLCGWGRPTLLAAMLLAYWNGVPVFVESDTPWMPVRRSWRDVIKRFLYPLLFRIPARLLPGGTLQAEYLRRYGVPDERIRIVHMTVDVEHIRATTAQCRADGLPQALRAACGIADTETIFIYVGRLETYKGVPQLLEAFALLRSQGCKAGLLIVGDGTLRGAVMRATEADSAVRWLGRLQGDDVVNAYCAADILVLPSASESWGLVVNEAMACGLPVIVSDRVGCAADLVIDGETGKVIPFESIRALTDAMAELARDRSGRERMGLAASSLISHWTTRNWARGVSDAWMEEARS